MDENVNCRECIHCSESSSAEKSTEDRVFCNKQNRYITGSLIEGSGCSLFVEIKSTEAMAKDLKKENQLLKEEIKKLKCNRVQECLERQLGRRDKKIKKLNRKIENISLQMTSMTSDCDRCKDLDKSELKEINKKQECSISVLKNISSKQLDKIRELKIELKELGEKLYKTQEAERYMYLDNLKLGDKIDEHKKHAKAIRKLINRNEVILRTQIDAVKGITEED